MIDFIDFAGKWLDCNCYYLACWFLVTANSLTLDHHSLHWWASDPYRASCFARAIFDLGFVQSELDMKDWTNALNVDYSKLKYEINWSLKLFNRRERQFNGLEP